MILCIHKEWGLGFGSEKRCLNFHPCLGPETNECDTTGSNVYSWTLSGKNQHPLGCKQRIILVEKFMRQKAGLQCLSMHQLPNVENSGLLRVAMTGKQSFLMLVVVLLCSWSHTIQCYPLILPLPTVPMETITLKVVVYFEIKTIANCFKPGQLFLRTAIHMLW